MKVKLLVGRAGADFSQNAGEIVEMSPDEAQRYVESEQAELVDAPKKKAPAKAATKADQAETR